MEQRIQELKQEVSSTQSRLAKETAEFKEKQRELSRLLKQDSVKFKVGDKVKILWDNANYRHTAPIWRYTGVIESELDGEYRVRELNSDNENYTLGFEASQLESLESNITLGQIREAGYYKVQGEYQGEVLIYVSKLDNEWYYIGKDLVVSLNKSAWEDSKVIKKLNNIEILENE